MTTSKRTLTKLTLGGALLMAACGAETATQPRTYTMDATGFDGIKSETFPVVATACTFSGAGVTPATMTLNVAAGETLYVFYRETDQKVVANATTDGSQTGPECTTAKTTKILINSTGIAGAHKVFLDYANAFFSMGTATNDASMSIRLGLASANVSDIVTIRGTNGVDNMNFGLIGATTTLQAAANLNFGTTTGLDKLPDITFGPAGMVRTSDVTDVKVTVGAMNDVITAQNPGIATGGSPFLIPLTVYGGDGNDTITSGDPLSGVLFNYLSGDAGNDTFVQQASKVADHIYGGTGTDLVDYSVRTAKLTITLGAGNNDGDGSATSEKDDLDGTIENVTGGTNDDIIDASLATTVTHTLRGGPIVSPAVADASLGNDTLKGSDLVDTLIGGPGDDTLQGGLGDDVITGNAGSDTIDFSDHTTDVVCSLDGMAGGSTVLLVTEKDVFNGVSGVDIENIRGGSGVDTLTGNGNANIIWGGVGADVIKGGGGNDSLYDQDDADDIDGEAGNDVVSGGDGVDTALKGGIGDDLIDMTDTGAGGVADTALDCGADNDVVLLDAADQTDYTANTLDPPASGVRSCETVL